MLTKMKASSRSRARRKSHGRLFKGLTLIAGIDPSELARRVQSGLAKGESHYPHTCRDQRAIDIDAHSKSPLPTCSSQPQAFMQVRYDFDPFLDLERLDVTDPMPAHA